MTLDFDYIYLLDENKLGGPSPNVERFDFGTIMAEIRPKNFVGELIF